MEATLSRCASCSKGLDEPPDLAADERKPCPACGSLARVIEGSSSLSIGVRISTTATKIHEEIERHPGWFFVLLVLTVASSIVGVVFVGIVGILIGLALGVLSYLVGRRAEVVVREIERG